MPRTRSRPSTCPRVSARSPASSRRDRAAAMPRPVVQPAEGHSARPHAPPVRAAAPRCSASHPVPCRACGPPPQPPCSGAAIRASDAARGMRQRCRALPELRRVGRPGHTRRRVSRWPWPPTRCATLTRDWQCAEAKGLPALKQVFGRSPRPPHHPVFKNVLAKSGLIASQCAEPNLSGHP